MSREPGRIAVLIAAALCGPAAAWAQPAGAPTRIFTCVDAQGRRLTSDRPIHACIDREQRELSPGGTVLRTLKPALTAEEEEAAARKARAEAAARADALELQRQAAVRRRLAAQESVPDVR